MDKPDKALIVTVLVPTLGPNQSSNGPWDGAIGTGCALDNDLILTARHVVQRPNRNHEHPIKVRWYALRCADEKSGWVDLDPNDADAIRWTGEGDLDAALVACPRPERLRDIPAYRLAVDPPAGLPAWESRGFPRASVVNARCEPGDFHGKVMSMSAIGDAFLSLTSELKTGDTPQDWSGASGMPVLVGDTIIGIIKEVSNNFDNRKLQAVPVYLLCAQRAFREAIGTRGPGRSDLGHQNLGRSLPANADRLLERHLIAFLDQRGISWLELQQEVLAAMPPYALYDGTSLDGWLLRPPADWQADGDGILTLGSAPRCFPQAPDGLQDASLLIWRRLAFERGRIEAAIWMPQLVAEGGAAGLVLSYRDERGAYVGILGCGRGSPATLRILLIDGDALSQLADPLPIPILPSGDAAELALSFARHGRRLELRMGESALTCDAAVSSGGYAGLIRFDGTTARFSQLRLAAG